MKVIILQEKLKEGLGIVEKIASRSLTLPILNNVLVSVDKNFLNLATTDLEVGINWWGLAKTEQEGRITIPSRLFSQFISFLPNKKIELEVEGASLFVKSDGNKTQIRGLSAEEFPIIPKVISEDFVVVDSVSFCQNLNQIVDIPILSTTRPEISGIYFLFQKNLITAAATDSFRLGEKKISLKGTSFLKKDYITILPQKTIKEIINIFNEKKGELKIYFSPHQTMFEFPMSEAQHPEIQIISRLIEGEYPNYKDIIPKKHITQAIIPRNEFLNQLKTASLFAGKTNEIKIKTNPEKNEIEISSQSIDVGEHQTNIKCKIKGEVVMLAFNYRFLLDGLLNIKSAEVVFELNPESGQGAGPSVLKPIGDESYLYVVMPIKAS